MKKLVVLLLISSIFPIGINAQSGSSAFFDEMQVSFDQEDYQTIIENEAKIMEKSSLLPDSIYAELLYFLGDSYLAFDSLDRALRLMEKELVIRTEMPNSDPLVIADLNNNLGYFLQLNGDYTKSREQLVAASDLYEEHLGIENQSYITTQIELAKIHGILGHHKKSMEVLKDLYKINLVKEEYLHIVNKELGLAYFDIGYYSKSENILKENLSLIEQNFGKESIEFVEGLVTLAIPYYYRSEYSKAELLYQEALELSNKISVSTLLTEKIKNNLGLLYKKIGLYNEASDLFEDIISEESNLHNASKNANYAQNLIALNEKELAFQYFDKSLAIKKELLGTNSELYVRGLKEKALALNQAHDLQNYYQLMQQSYNGSKDLLAKENPEYSKYELQWGIANFRLNNINEAEKHINSAHDLRSKYLSKNHPLFAETSKELAELSWYKDNPKNAKKYFKETFDNYFGQIEAYFPALSEQQKANFYTNTLRSTFEEYNSFAIAYKDTDPSLLGDMYDYQLATKGLIMYATAKARKAIMNSENGELKEQYENWISTKELISQLYSMSEEEMQQQDLKLDSLISVSSEIEKELSRASAEFSDAYTAKNYSWKDVQSKLKKGEAAIEMIRFKEFTPDSSGMFKNKVNYAALLIDKESEYPKLILFENGRELENKYIKNYRNSIRYKVDDKFSYDFYWKPIAKETKKYNKLYFSPDGIYNQISVNVLFNTETEKYVLEEQNIELLTNTKDLIAYRTVQENSNVASNPTFFGFPNYNKGLLTNTENDQETASKIVENTTLNRGLRGSLQRYIRGNSLVTALPGTKEEVQQIEKIYADNSESKPKTFLENNADEIQLKSVKNPQVLHIATHGFFLEDVEETNSQEEDKYSENPLLKSGLIMAGANSFISSGIDQGNKQDGILTAYEAMNLDLSNTELVVLSACETGLGDLKNGEGVYGLRRAFQVAGADAIIMSLWSVDDAATQELMTAFYQNWIGGQDKLSAFNSAQKTIKDKYESPFYWGAFVMVGE